MATAQFKLPALPKMSKRERTMAVVGAVVMFLVVADRLAIGPWLKYIKKINKEVRTLEQGIDQQRQLLSRRGRILAEAENYKDYLRVGELPEMEMASFLKEVESVGKQTKISLREIKPLTTNPGEFFQEYGLEVHYECSFDQCLNFIHAIESLPGLYSIEKAVLSVNQEKPSFLKGYFRIRKTIMQQGLKREVADGT